MKASRHSRVFIQLSFLAALILSIFPLPENLLAFNPQWLVLIAAYWGITSPEKAGLVTSWIWGLLLDVALGTHLGIHAISLSLVSYMAVILHLRLRMYPIWQQSLFIWLLAGLDKLVTLQLSNIFNNIEVSWNYWYTTLATALIWPMILFVLHKYHQAHKLP